MPLVFEQPNLDVPDEMHLYFDPGDGRLITFFVRPTRTNDPTPNPQDIGNLHHLAFTVSRATYTQVAKRLQELGAAVPPDWDTLPERIWRWVLVQSGTDNALKRAESEDYFDLHTNFSPFRGN